MSGNFSLTGILSATFSDSFPLPPLAVFPISLFYAVDKPPPTPLMGTLNIRLVSQEFIFAPVECDLSCPSRRREDNESGRRPADRQA